MRVTLPSKHCNSPEPDMKSECLRITHSCRKLRNAVDGVKIALPFLESLPGALFSLSCFLLFFFSCTIGDLDPSVPALLMLLIFLTFCEVLPLSCYK